MCGIVGLVGERASASMAGVTTTIQHRGPDDEGTFSDANVWLGHRRLSIVDLSKNGHQPMISTDGNYILVFNGEIYNHSNIRKPLIDKGYSFKSSSDTETLLYALVEFGPTILKKLNGIFAFAFYDKHHQTVLLARDQFGTKPLYYYHRDNMLGFSSEIKALLKFPGFNSEVNHTALFYYLQMLYAPGELTPFRHVKKLLPGHYMEYNIAKKTFSTTQYYCPSFTKPSTHKSEAELVDELDDHLTKAVDRQLMSDVPVGYFLSGGLDSSLIVAMAKKLQPKHKLNCFTISTGDDMQREGFADDLHYAQKVAAYLSVDLNVIPAAENVTALFDKMIWHLDEPQADVAPLHVYNIACGAQQAGIKVLLGGTGGDDIFSGYRRHQAVNMEKYMRMTPQWARNTLSKSAGVLTATNPATRRFKKLFADAGVSKEERLARYFSWMPEAAVSSLFQPHIRKQLNNEVLPNAYLQNLLKTVPSDTSDLDKMLFLEMNTFLPDHNLNYTDKLSMAAGVEARVPFLDLDLVEFATALPVQYKMKGSTTKYLLKKVAERYLPNDVIYRPKTGFGAPVRTWLKTSLKPMMLERLSEQRLKAKAIFDHKEVAALINNTMSGKTDASYSIWSLMAIDSWMDQFHATAHGN